MTDSASERATEVGCDIKIIGKEEEREGWGGGAGILKRTQSLQIRVAIVQPFLKPHQIGNLPKAA